MNFLSTLNVERFLNKLVGCWRYSWLKTPVMLRSNRLMEWITMLKYALVVPLVLGMLSTQGCSDPSGKSSYGEVGSGLTNFSVACRKHDGLDSYKTKGNKTYITCNNGKKFTYHND